MATVNDSLIELPARGNFLVSVDGVVVLRTKTAETAQVLFRRLNAAHSSEPGVRIHLWFEGEFVLSDLN